MAVKEALARLTSEAERHEAEARKRREKLADEEAREAAARAERARAAAVAYLEAYDPQELETELAEAYSRLIAGVEKLVEHPAARAVVAYLAASERRTMRASEANNCRVILGRTPDVFEPRAREIDLVNVFVQAAARRAGAIVEAERETLTAARAGASPA
jgi:hypothetical protein